MFGVSFEVMCVLFLTASLCKGQGTLPAPTLSNPPNGATGQTTTPAFSWSSVTGANRYWVMVAPSASAFPTDPAATSRPTCLAAGYASSASYTWGGSWPFGVSNGANPPPALSGGTTYYWKVQGFNNTTTPNVNGQYSAASSFSTTASLLPAPTLSNPPHGSTVQSMTPTFSWSSVIGATSYRIMVATNPADLPTDPTASSGGASVVINDMSSGPRSE